MTGLAAGMEVKGSSGRKEARGFFLAQQERQLNQRESMGTNQMTSSHDQGPFSAFISPDLPKYSMPKCEWHAMPLSNELISCSSARSVRFQVLTASLYVSTVLLTFSY